LEGALIQKRKESEIKMKKLHQIIIESGQSGYAPDDNFVTSEFTSLNNSIMRVVKKHYTYPNKTLPKSVKWRQYLEYSPENRELFLRSIIADRLYKYFHSPEAGVYGLDKDTDAEMADFERTMRKSGKGRILGYSLLAALLSILQFSVRYRHCGLESLYSFMR
jgi:hypothetical protein